MDDSRGTLKIVATLLWLSWCSYVYSTGNWFHCWHFCCLSFLKIELILFIENLSWADPPKGWSSQGLILPRADPPKGWSSQGLILPRADPPKGWPISWTHFADHPIYCSSHRLILQWADTTCLTLLRADLTMGRFYHRLRGLILLWYDPSLGWSPWTNPPLGRSFPDWYFHLADPPLGGPSHKLILFPIRQD
jgi:hypothetical protein